MNRQRMGTIAGVLGLLALFVGLAVSSAVRESATYDEPTHLAAGYSYLRCHDFRLNPEHPPLLKELAALPLLWQPVWPASIEPTAQSLAKDSVTTRTIQSAWALAMADIEQQWFFSHYWLYSPRDETLQRFGVNHPLLLPTMVSLRKTDFQNDADRLFFWGRLPLTLLGALLGLLVFFWARALFGTAGGLLALALYCCDPNFIAHSGLVTTDVGLSLFLFGALYFLWRFCERRTVLNVLGFAVFCGLAASAKFSAILLGPMAIALVLLWIFATTPRASGLEIDMQRFPRLMQMPKYFAVLLLAALTAIFFLWATYGFRFSAARDPARAAELENLIGTQGNSRLPANREPGHFPLESVLRRSAAIHSLQPMYPQAVPEDAIRVAMQHVELRPSGNVLLFARQWHLLPEAYLYGFAYAEMRSLSRGAYLLGQRSERGWWYYFPIAFLLKTPTVTLLLLGAALVFLARKHPVRWIRLMFLLVPVLIYVAVSVTSHLNIGHRHLLPIYPFLFVLCGSLGLVWQKLASNRRPLVAVAVLGAIGINTHFVLAPPWRPAPVYPHYLAYFNEFAGGPRNGYKRLLDSNLDWGQDLKNLQAWLDRYHIHEPVNLSYFGTADPRFYGIAHANLLGAYAFEPETPLAQVRVPAYFIISATYLQGVYQSPQAHLVWQEILKTAKLIDTVGYSIFIYYHY